MALISWIYNHWHLIVVKWRPSESKKLNRITDTDREKEKEKNWTLFESQKQIRQVYSIVKNHYSGRTIHIWWHSSNKEKEITKTKIFWFTEIIIITTISSTGYYNRGRHLSFTLSAVISAIILTYTRQWGVVKWLSSGVKIYALCFHFRRFRI